MNQVSVHQSILEDGRYSINVVLRHVGLLSKFHDSTDKISKLCVSMVGILRTSINKDNLTTKTEQQ